MKTHPNEEASFEQGHMVITSSDGHASCSCGKICHFLTLTCNSRYGKNDHPYLAIEVYHEDAGL